MNYKVCARSVITLLILYGMSSYAMNDNNLSSSQSLPHYDFEKHPLLYGAIEPALTEFTIKHDFASALQSVGVIEDTITKPLFDMVSSSGDALDTITQVFTQYRKHGPWLMGRTPNETGNAIWKMNLDCGLGLVELLRGNTEEATTLLVQSNAQGSCWGSYYVGALPFHTTAPNALIPPYVFNCMLGYFDRAVSISASHHMPSVMPYWYRHLMAVGLGFEEEERKNNFVIWFDRWLCKSYKTSGLAYLLACSSRGKQDEKGSEKLCLERAIQENNQYLPLALNDYGVLLFAEQQNAEVLSYLRRAMLLGSPSASVNLNKAEAVLAEKAQQLQQAALIVPLPVDSEMILPVDSKPCATTMELSTGIVVTGPLNTQGSNVQSESNINNNREKAYPQIAEASSNTQESMRQDASPVATERTATDAERVNATPDLQTNASSVSVGSNEYNRIAQIQDFSSYSDTRLKQYGTIIDTAERQGINVHAVRMRLYGAMRTNVTNQAKRISLLLDHAQHNDRQASYELGLYYLDNPNNKDKGREQKGWEYLKQAADDNYADACHAYITRGFADAAKKGEVVSFIDRLLADTMRMTQVALNDNQKADIYALRGYHALNNKEEGAARNFLQQALDLGNSRYAYELGLLYAENNDFNKAKQSFGCVADHKKNQADWNRALLNYAICKDFATRCQFLQTLVMPFCDESSNGLSDEDIRTIIIEPKILDILTTDSSTNNNAQAAYMLGYCASQGWTNNNKPDLVQALNFYKTAIVYAIDDANVRNNAIRRIRAMTEYSAATEYIREEYPTTDEKAAADIYQAIVAGNVACLKNCSGAVYRQIEKDARAGMMAAHYAFAYSVITDANRIKDRRLLTQALEYVKTIEQTYDCRKLKGNLLYALTSITTDVQVKLGICKQASDHGNSIASFSLFQYYMDKGDSTQADIYLKQAIENGSIHGRIVAAIRILNKGNGQKEVDEVIAMVKDIEQRIADINFEEEVEDSYRAQYYELQVSLTNFTKNNVMTLKRKAVEAGSLRYAREIIFGLLNAGKIEEIERIFERMSSLQDEDLILVYKYLHYKKQSPAQQGKQPAGKTFTDLLCCRLKRAIALDDLSYMARDGALIGDLREKAAQGNANACDTLVLLADQGYDVGLPGDQLERYKDAGIRDHRLYIVSARIAEQKGMFQAAIEEIITGLAKEQCVGCHAYGKDYLSGLLSKNDPHRCSLATIGVWQEAYKKLSANAAGQDQDLLYKIWSAICGYYYEIGNVEELHKWYSTSFAREDEQGLLFSALLHEHNKFKIKPVDAAKAMMQCLKQAAELGNPHAQYRLSTIFERGIQLPCKALIQQSDMNTRAWTLALINNARATQEQKNFAYLLCGEMTAMQIAKTTDRAEKQKMYTDSQRYCQQALQNKEYRALPLLVSMCGDMGDIDRIEELYNTYINNEDVLKNSKVLLAFAVEVVHHKPHYIKTFVDHIIKLNIEINNADESTAKDMYDMVNALRYLRHTLTNLVTIFKPKNESFKLCGYNTTQEIRMAISALNDLLKDGGHEASSSSSSTQQNLKQLPIAKSAALKAAADREAQEIFKAAFSE